MRVSASFGLAPKQALNGGVISARMLGANCARLKQFRVCTLVSGMAQLMDLSEGELFEG